MHMCLRSGMGLFVANRIPFYYLVINVYHLLSFANISSHRNCVAIANTYYNVNLILTQIQLWLELKTLQSHIQHMHIQTT